MTGRAASGPTLLVTRPQPQADAWVAQLAARGLPALALPLLAIEPAPEAGPVLAAWQGLADKALVMFVSPNAAERFFELQPAHCPWPAATLAAGTGPGTYRALLAAGVPAAQICTPGRLDAGYAGSFDSEALWQALAGQDWAGRQALIVRGQGGRDWLADVLRQHGAAVHFVEAYRRSRAVLDTSARRRLQAVLDAPASYLWLLSSSEAVGYLPAWLPPGQAWAAHQALATHGRIAGAARALGLGRVDLCDPTPDAVALALRTWLPTGARGLPGQAPPIQSGGSSIAP